MIGGLIVGLIIFAFAFAIGHFAIEFEWEWHWAAKILFWLVIFLLIVGAVIGIGIWIDDADWDRIIATWDTTKASYEQAMSAYESYESMVKDNPELIKEAITKNEQLANYKFAATRWWYWYVDDSIQDLEPIIIGGTN